MPYKTYIKHDQSSTTSATKSSSIHLQFAIHPPPQQCILEFSDVPPQRIICARRARSRTNKKYRPHQKQEASIQFKVCIKGLNYL
jgi:hypothetical protein